jgi:hypothetical protein
MKRKDLIHSLLPFVVPLVPWPVRQEESREASAPVDSREMLK